MFSKMVEFEVLFLASWERHAILTWSSDTQTEVSDELTRSVIF
jgi:hypothetical protein